MEPEKEEKYIKNYELWNNKKRALNERVMPDDFFFLEREVWWTSLGVNIGKEIDGKNEYFERPVLILTKFTYDTFLGVPISSQYKAGENFHVFSYQESDKVISLQQVRFLSSHRLLKLMFRLEEVEFNLIKKKAMDILGGVLLEKEKPL